MASTRTCEKVHVYFVLYASTFTAKAECASDTLHVCKESDTLHVCKESDTLHVCKESDTLHVRKADLHEVEKQPLFACVCVIKCRWCIFFITKL